MGNKNENNNCASHPWTDSFDDVKWKRGGKTNKQTKQKHAPPQQQKRKIIIIRKQRLKRRVCGTDNLIKYLQNRYWITLLSVEFFSLQIIFWSYRSTLGNIFDLNPPRRLYRSLDVSGWETDPNYIIHQLITPSIWMILLWVSRSQVLYVVYIFAVIATIMMLFFVTVLHYY